MFKKILRIHSIYCLLALSMSFFMVPSLQAAAKEMQLLTPQKTVGMPVMEALNLRASNRKIKDITISKQDLSNLLWAAWGINRENGKHTVPTAHNKQELFVFAVLKSGVWEYDPANHRLVLLKSGDFTAKFKSPLTLLYIAPEAPADVSGMHVGSMYQSVALYCASANLANTVKITPRDALSGEIELPAGYKFFVAQVIGMPR